MDRDEKRIKIAEACGWTLTEATTLKGRPIYEKAGERAATAFSQFDGDTLRVTKWLPNYFHDLNDMHQAEKQLKGDNWIAYVKLIAKACEEFKGVSHATAAQRAEAFGITLELWKP